MLGSSRVRRFAGIISMLFTGTLLGSVLSFLSQILLARSMGLAEFGRLSALLTAINFFTPVASAGVNWFLLRVFGAEGQDAVRWFRPVTQLIGLATSLSCVGLAAYAAFGNVAPNHTGFIIMASILVLFGQTAVELGSSSFQLEDRYRALTLWQMATQAGRLLVVLVATLSGGPTEVTIIGGYGVLGLVLSVIGTRSLRSAWRRADAEAGPQRRSAPGLRDTLKESTPYAVMTVFYVLYFQGVVVLVAWMAGNAAAAEYNASFLIFSALSLIPNVIYMKFLAAKLCRWAEADRPTFVAAFHVGVPAMALLGGGLAVLLISTAHWIIPLLYGAKYEGAVTLVVIRAIAIPIGFTQMSYSSLFISATDMSRKIVYLGLSALVSLGLTVLLVPGLGIAGAAVASVFAEAVLLVLHMHGAARHIPGIEITATLRPSTLVGSLRHLLHPEQAQAGRRAKA